MRVHNNTGQFGVLQKSLRGHTCNVIKNTSSPSPNKPSKWATRSLLEQARRDEKHAGGTTTAPGAAHLREVSFRGDAPPSPPGPTDPPPSHQAGAPRHPGRRGAPGSLPTRGAAPSPPAPASSAWWRPSTAPWRSGPPARTPARGAAGDSAAQGSPGTGTRRLRPAPRTRSPLTLTSLDTGLAADVLSCRTCGTHSGGLAPPRRLPSPRTAREEPGESPHQPPAAPRHHLQGQPRRRRHFVRPPAARGHGAARPRVEAARRHGGRTAPSAARRGM